MAVDAVSSATSSTSSTAYGLDALEAEDFLQFMIVELQNQDPLDPVDNKQLLDQLSTINSLISNEELAQTLEALNQTQGLGAASNLIGKTIRATTLEGNELSGVVAKAVMEDGDVSVVLEDNTTIALSLINEIS